MYCIVDRYTKKNAFVTSVKKRVQMHLGKLQEERMESIVHWFAANMPSFLSPEVAVFLVSMVPILELRGGLLLATLLKIPMTQAIVICIIGNLIPIPFILLFIKQIFKWLKKTKLFCPFIEKLERRAMGKSDQIKRYEFWGLVLFVGIPLPGTGAWTGSLVASLLEVDLKKSVPAILLGLCMATVIMCIVGYGALGSILS